VERFPLCGRVYARDEDLIIDYKLLIIEKYNEYIKI
jgi:hypothetical protein